MGTQQKRFIAAGIALVAMATLVVGLSYNTNSWNSRDQRARVQAVAGMGSAADGTVDPTNPNDSTPPDPDPGVPIEPLATVARSNRDIVAGIIAGCAKETSQKIAMNLPVKGVKLDLDLVKDISECANKKFVEFPQLKDWADVADAVAIHLGCVGDITGLKDAIKKFGAKEAVKIAGKTYVKAVMAAASLVGSKDCVQVGARLGFYDENNVALVLINTGANCAVASIGYGIDVVIEVQETAALTKDMVIEKLRKTIESHGTKAPFDITKLPKLNEAIEKMFKACGEAKAAAKAAGQEVKQGVDFFATGGVINTGVRRIVLLPDVDRFWQFMRYLRGESEPQRYAVRDVQVMPGALRDWFVKQSPSAADGVVITGASGSITVTRDNPHFSLDGYSGRINFAPGSFSAVFDLAAGGRQTFPLGADGKIIRTLNADGSIAVLSRIVANGLGWDVLSVARGNNVESTLRETDGHMILKTINGQLSEVRYGDGTVETVFYDADDKLVGSKVVYADGTVGYAKPKDNGKLAIDSIIMPDGTSTKVTPVLDDQGNVTAKVGRNDRGETILFNAKNEILAIYHASNFTAAGKPAGAVRCETYSCYTVTAEGTPLLYVDRDGRVYRVASYIDQNGKTRKISDFDPKKGDVIAQVIPEPDSAFSAANRTIDVPTAASMEAAMRALFGLNLYQGGGELGGPVVLQQCPLGGCSNYTTTTVNCGGQSIPVLQAASQCAQLWQQQQMEFLAKLNNAEAYAVDIPAQLQAGKTYRVRVGISNTSGDKAPVWMSPETLLVANNTNWGPTQVGIPNGSSFAGGGKVEFVFDIVAPSTPGTYGFQWHMERNGVRFGTNTPNVEVEVVAPEAAAVAVVDAFNYGLVVKRSSYASIFGTQLAEEIAQSGDPTKTECKGVLGARVVELFRVDGSVWIEACMTYVSPQQINIYVPSIPIGNYMLALNDTNGVTLVRSAVFWIGD